MNDTSTKTLLLVEDEALIAMNEAMILKNYGFNVLTVYTGEAAIETVNETSVDLILMDINLGRNRLDGTQTAQKILEKYHIPIVFLTSHSEKHIVDKVKGITRYGYVLKNSGEFVLVEAINMAFELFEANKKMQSEFKERKEAESALNESLQMFNDIVQAMPSGLFIYQYQEPDQLILLAGNPESERLTGIDLKSCIGKEFNEIWPNARKSGVTDSFLNVYHSGETLETDDLYYEDNRLKGAFRVRVFKAPHNQLGVAFENITDIKKAERELQQNRKLLDSIVEHIPTLVFVKDGKDLTFTLFNKAWVEFSGIPREGMIGKNDYDFFPKEEADFFTRKDREVLESGELLVIPEEEIQTRRGKRKLYTKKVPIFGNDGKPAYILGISEDITERLKAQRELIEREERFRSAVQMASDAIVVCNIDDTIIFWNKAAEKIFGFTSNEMTGKTVESIIPKRFRKKYRENVQKRIELGREAVDPEIREFSACRKDGTEFPVERSISSWKANDQLFITRVYRDISLRKRILEDTQESEERYRTLFEQAPDGILTASLGGFITSCNPAFLSLTGFKKEDIVGKHFTGLPTLRKKDLPTYVKLFASMLAGKQPERREFIWRNAQGEERTGEACIGFHKREKKTTGFQFILRDITESKTIARKFEESEQRYHTLFNAANEAIFLADADTGIIIDANKQAESLTGRSREEIIGMHQSELHPKEQEQDVIKSFQDQQSRSRQKTFTSINVVHKNGSQTLVEISTSIMNIENRKVILGIFRDITERRQHEKALQEYNEELKKALLEKDYLFQEINHRVKNNLAMINSLVRLKTSALGNGIDLSDLEHQIDAIRIVHEKLYQSNEISTIDFRLYVQELLETVFASFSNQHVNINNKIQKFSLDPKTSVPLGLVINEFATNALKYGFNEDSPADFTVAMEREAHRNEYVLRVSNTGNPFPADIDLDHVNTLGLRIVSLLVEQLEGNLDIAREPYPVFTIRFPAENVK